MNIMREIVFRGKRCDNGSFVFGNLLLLTKFDIMHGDLAAVICNYEDGYLYNVIPETIGQYTGIKDINGASIFEGDLVECENYHGIVYGRVAYYHSYFYLSCYEFSDEILRDCCKFNVLGNIYENDEEKIFDDYKRANKCSRYKCPLNANTFKECSCEETCIWYTP